MKFVRIKIKNWEIPLIIDDPVYNINLEISNKMQFQNRSPILVTSQPFYSPFRYIKARTTRLKFYRLCTTWLRIFSHITIIYTMNDRPGWMRRIHTYTQGRRALVKINVMHAMYAEVTVFTIVSSQKWYSRAATPAARKRTYLPLSHASTVSLFSISVLFYT